MVAAAAGGGGGDRRKKRKSDARGRPPVPGGNNQSPNVAAPPQWTSSYNPWQGVVQAWPLNVWRPSVLGSRPGVQPPQAMAALTAPPPQHDVAAYSGTTPHIPLGLYSAFNTMSINSNTGGGDWFLDTGATSHMAAHPGILSTHSPIPVPRQIVVGMATLYPHRAPATPPLLQILLLCICIMF